MLNKTYYSTARVFKITLLSATILTTVLGIGSIIYGLVFSHDPATLEGWPFAFVLIYLAIASIMPGFILSIFLWDFFKLNFSLTILVIFILFSYFLANIILEKITGTNQMDLYYSIPYLALLPGFFWVWKTQPQNTIMKEMKNL